MKKKIIILILSVIISQLQYAQDLISTSGKSIKNLNSQVDYSIGEIMVDTYSGDEMILTQGLHQPKIIITEITNFKLENMEIKLFPNPTSSLLHIVLNDIQDEIKVSLIDMNGRLISKDKLLNKKESLNISNLSNGEYILQFITNSKIIKSYTIIKE